MQAGHKTPYVRYEIFFFQIKIIAAQFMFYRIIIESLESGSKRQKCFKEVLLKIS